MRHSTTIIYNTLASYARILTNVVVTLFSTRIALKYLGVSDYGLFNLIAGVVAMLSFLNGALLISSQRYFSISIGKGDKEKLHQYFNVSLGIHFLLGLVIGIVFIVLTPFIFDGSLNIPVGRVSIAIKIYFIVVLSSVITVATIPYTAMMNAKEDMVALAIIDIIHCLGKLFAAIALTIVNKHLLIVYASILLCAVIVKMLLEIAWSKKKYPEVEIEHGLFYQRDKIKEMIGFVGWNTLGSIAIIARNQGIAVTLNIFWGTLINAAYGIANQINSLVLSFSTTLTTVFTPMIIQAKGAGDEKKMMQTGIFSSKMSFLLSSIIALPILLFLSDFLYLWLENVPPSTLEFTSLMILSFLVQQLYPGINRIIYATGKIKYYQITVSVLLMLPIPIGCILFKRNFDPYWIMVAVFIAQVFTLVATIYYANLQSGLRVKNYAMGSVIKPVCMFIATYLLSYTLDNSLCTSTSHSLRYIIAFSVPICVIYFISYIFIVLDNVERKLIYKAIQRK